MLRTISGCFLLAAAVLAQRGEAPGHSRHGSLFDDGPRRAAVPMAGLGDCVHLPVAGLSTEAQRLFDQGLVQLHGFWYHEAERSFRQVAALQPDTAMAYWGMAMANVEHKPRAAGLIAEAVRRSATVPRREQLWIDAWANYYRVDQAARDELRSGDAARAAAAVAALVANNAVRDERPLALRLIEDLETLVADDPDDIEAKALLALQIWLNYDWGQGIPIGSHAAVDALLDQVFQRAPLHPAHHYRVHLWDQREAGRALRSAALVGASAPAIAHQWHMAGHIYAKLHRHAEAAWQQEASARVDHDQLARAHELPFRIHNYGHNQEWLCRSLTHRGQLEAALAVAQNLAAIPRHPRHNPCGELDGDESSIAVYARQRFQSACEDLRAWQAALDLAAAGWLDRTTAVAAELPRVALLGRAHFRLGQIEAGDRFVAEAAELLRTARAARAAAVDAAEDAALATPADAGKVREAVAEAARSASDPVRAVFDLQRELRGERLLATGDAAAAVRELEAVEGLPKALLADALLAAGEPGRAIEVLEREVAERPHRLPTVARLVLAHDAALARDPAHDPQRARDLRQELAALGVSAASAAAPRSPLEAQVLTAAADRPAAAPACLDGAATLAPAADTLPADFGERPPLPSLGPLFWQPFAAPAFDLPGVDGGRRSLAAQRGRPTLLVFYLGFGCLHCVQQLEALAPHAAPFAAAGIDVLAIGNQPLAEAQEQLAALGTARFPFPLLADPALAAFRAFGCHDDFEALPLHGTVLLDGDGRVRWVDVGAEPFTRFEWLLPECRRLLALPVSG
ncbi:MAG: redoxin domain-containing protein [Planctomycetes bacterium]|nr:redoxin domain-containing protein [Planctomycetota bacterium]